MSNSNINTNTPPPNLLNVFVPCLAPTDENTLKKANSQQSIGNAQNLTIIGKKTYLNTDAGKFEIALPPIENFNLPPDADFSAIAQKTIESLLNLTPSEKTEPKNNAISLNNVVNFNDNNNSESSNNNAFFVLAALFSLASATGKAEYSQGLSNLVSSLRDTLSAAQERFQAARTEMIGGIIAGTAGAAAGVATIGGGIKGDKTITNSEKVKNPAAQPINPKPTPSPLTDPAKPLPDGADPLLDPAGSTITPPPAEPDITKTNTYTTAFSGKWAGAAAILNASGQMADSIAKGLAANKTLASSEFDAQAKALDSAMTNAKATKEQMVSFLQQVLQIMKEQSQAKQDTLDTLSSAAGV